MLRVFYVTAIVASLLVVYIKSKLVMPVKQLQVSGNNKTITILWDRRQLNPTCTTCGLIHTVAVYLET